MAQLDLKYPDPKTHLIGFCTIGDNKKKLIDGRQSRQSNDIESHTQKRTMINSVIKSIDCATRKKSKELTEKIADITFTRYQAESTKGDKRKCYITERRNGYRQKSDISNIEINGMIENDKKSISTTTNKKFKRTRNENKSMIQGVRTVVEKESQINMKTDSRFAKRSELYCIAENISPEGESIKEHENKLIVNESTARKKITIKKDIIKDCTTIKHYFKEKLLNNI